MENTHDENRAVAPVIGVVLLVGMTVILAAIVATFAFGLIGDMDPQVEEPNADFAFEKDRGTITVTHNSGESVSASRLTVSGDVNGSPVVWAEHGTVEKGDSITIETTGEVDDVYVVWTSAIGERHLLAEYDG